MLACLCHHLNSCTSSMKRRHVILLLWHVNLLSAFNVKLFMSKCINKTDDDDDNSVPVELVLSSNYCQIICCAASLSKHHWVIASLEHPSSHGHGSAKNEVFRLPRLQEVRKIPSGAARWLPGMIGWYPPRALAKKC